MIQEELYRLIASHISGNASPEESEKLEAWKAACPENEELYTKLKKRWHKLNDLATGIEPQTNTAKQKFISRIKHYQKRSLYLRIGQVAAAALVIISIATLGWRQTNSDMLIIENNTAQSMDYYLPDSSLVVLNKNAQIEFHKAFAERKLQLQGTAYFEVRKQAGKNFSIQTGKTTTEVLGTSFCIEEMADATVQISVLSGKVKFENTKQKASVVLVKNQQAKLTPKAKNISTSALKNKNFLAWKTGMFSFDNQKLREILPFLEKYYETSFNIENKEILDLEITCQFNNQPIEEVLEELEVFLPIGFEKKGKEFKVKNYE